MSTTDEFQVTLPSNSSASYFPNNSPACFTTMLPTNIDLEGDWEVGLMDIQYPFNWPNSDELLLTFIFKLSPEAEAKFKHTCFFELTPELAQLQNKTYDVINNLQHNVTSSNIFVLPKAYYESPYERAKYLCDEINNILFEPDAIAEINVKYDTIAKRLRYTTKNVEWYAFCSLDHRLREYIGFESRFEHNVYIVQPSTEVSLQANLKQIGRAHV